MLRLIPWFVKQPFSLPFWSFSFGVSALAKASLNMSMTSTSDFMQLLSTALFIFANAVILLLIWHSLLWFFKGLKQLYSPSKVV
jgi:tellurite resistance protein